MKITIKNLGVLKQAEFSLGKLTVICGGNNTGKTYATHATYGLLDYLRTNTDFPIGDDILPKIADSGHVSIPLDIYTKTLSEHFDQTTLAYTKLLPNVFAGNEKNFAASEIKFSLNKIPLVLSDVSFSVGIDGKTLLRIQSTADKKVLDVKWIGENASRETFPTHIIKEVIVDGICRSILWSIIPEPFLASAERTGAAIFQKELDFTRNRVLEMLGDKTSKIHPLQFLVHFQGEYPLAVRRNVDFIRALPNIRKTSGYIPKNRPELLNDFRDIIGGEYRVTGDGGINYVPSGAKSAKLSLVESSSAVRSLLDVSFYLQHIAKPGDLFMIDEPELNLHPENQRRIARLFARLVNIGIKVFMTTHSDYIVKEFNTLIMLGQKNNKRLQAIAKREHYRTDELLNYEDVRVYIAEDAKVKLNGNQRASTYQTLVAADISPDYGIDARSFDKTIDDMNRIQEEIVWGSEPLEEELCDE